MSPSRSRTVAGTEPTEAGRESPCPKCGSNSVVRVEYGDPFAASRAAARVRAGKFVLGGCLSTPGTFYGPHREESRRVAEQVKA